jgi:hypothetical protein
MGEMDTDTIGLIILIAAVLAVIVAGSGKRAKLRPMQLQQKITLRVAAIRTRQLESCLRTPEPRLATSRRANRPGFRRGIERPQRGGAGAVFHLEAADPLSEDREATLSATAIT